MSSPESSPASGTGSVPLADRLRGLEQALADEQAVCERLRQDIRKLQQHAAGVEKEIIEKTRHLEEARSIAESASQAKSMFLANMSHELRTPLNAILGFSEALVAGIFGELDAKHKEYINEIYKSGMNLLSLINEILDLSRMESGLADLDCSESSVSEIVMSSGHVFREKAKKHSIEVVTAVEEGTGLFTVDARKIRQVLVNILSYMFGYTADGGVIRIRGRQVVDPEVPGTGSSSREGLSGEFVEITVEDSGPEIAADEQRRLFEPFGYQEDMQYRKYDGPVLSLVVCRKIAEIHKGRIWAESTAPSGADTKGRNRFIFLLPRNSCDDNMRQE